MKALVTTSQNLLMIDLSSREIIPLDVASGQGFFGVSWFPQATELVLSHYGVRNNDLRTLEDYALSEKGYLTHGVNQTSPFLSAPHQILCASDGRVVCANTGRNCVTAIDLKAPNYFHEARVSSSRWDRLSLEDTSGDHLNSLFERDGTLFVIAHGHSKGSGLARFSYPALDLLDVEYFNSLSGLHNICVTDDGQYLSCNSNAGALIDLKDTSLLWQSGAQVYTRGLAVSDDHVLVGESVKARRDARDSSAGGLWMLDRKNWRAVDYIPLGQYGAVHDVRFLDVVDFAHHGSPFKGIPHLSQLDLRVTVTERRLADSEAARITAGHWANYNLVYGTPAPLADGSRRAPSGDPCLAIQKDESVREVAYTYEIPKFPADANVSIVLGYNGAGADRNMWALLLQGAGETSSLRVWRHNGDTWGHAPEVVHEGLPLTGELSAVEANNVLLVSVSGAPPIRVDLPSDLIGGTGIRWMGCTVRPIQRM